MRATGESEGEYIGMGWLDKDDLKCWIDLIIKQNNNSNINYMVRQWVLQQYSWRQEMNFQAMLKQ